MYLCWKRMVVSIQSQICTIHFLLWKVSFIPLPYSAIFGKIWKHPTSLAYKAKGAYSLTMCSMTDISLSLLWWKMANFVVSACFRGSLTHPTIDLMMLVWCCYSVWCGPMASVLSCQHRHRTFRQFLQQQWQTSIVHKNQMENWGIWGCLWVFANSWTNGDRFPLLCLYRHSLWLICHSDLSTFNLVWMRVCSPRPWLLTSFTHTATRVVLLDKILIHLSVI